VSKRGLLIGCATVGVLALGAVASPARAASGPAFAFVRDDGTAKHLVTTDGSHETTYPEQLNPTAVEWTADGSRIVVEDSLSTLDVFSNGGLERSFSPAIQPVLSPDREKATFGSSSGCPSTRTTCDLKLVAIDGSLSVDLGASDTAAAGWSPDGRHLAYERHGASGPEIWAADADGGNRHLVTAAPAGCTSIVWLANDELVFVDQVSFGPGIWTFHPGDAAATRSDLPAFGDTTTITRSPDGRHYALSSSGAGSPDRTAIFGLDDTLEVERGGEKIGTGVGVGGTSPGYIWSPDSRKILLSTCVDLSSFGDVGPCKLILLDVATSTEQLLMAGPDEILLSRDRLFGGASFSPDGSQVIVSYRNPDTGTLQLYVFRTDGSGVTTLPDAHADSLPAVRPSVSSGGGPPTASELAPDGGFEGDTTTAWRGLHERGGASTFTTDATGPHSGSRDGEISSTGDSTSLARYLSAFVPVDAGVTYHLSAYLRAAGVAGVGRIDVTFWGADGGYIPGSAMSSADAGQSVAGTTPWTQVGIDVTAPPGAVRARLEERLYGTGTLFVDDVSFTAAG
jgi:Tol biopolymer transport system component